MRTWQLQEAKAHLSEVVKAATIGNPQEITLRGQPAVVVLSKVQYVKLLKPKLSFIDFMRQSPLAGVEIDLARNRSSVREIEL